VQPSFVTHLPEDSHLSGRNTLESHYVYNIHPNTCICWLCYRV
jgi:hypothetical protein